MSLRLQSQSYGKSRVRVTQLDRRVDPHRLVIATASISLDGDFAASYTKGDNRKVIATDSIRNTVYVFAREQTLDPIESFAALLARHFGAYPQVSSVRVRIEREEWCLLESSAGATFPHAFSKGSQETSWTTAVLDDGGALSQRSGLDGLAVLKSAASGFSDFYRDRYTTLADTDDRLFATTVQADWLHATEPANWNASRAAIRAAMLETFARHQSRAVQETLYAMAGAALAAEAGISEVHICLPNQHHLLFDLSKFGLDNPNVVFVPTDEPFGRIEATVSR